MKEIIIKLNQERKTKISSDELTLDEIVESMLIAYIQAIHTIKGITIRKCLEKAATDIFNMYLEIIADPELEKKYFIINEGVKNYGI